MIWHHVTAEQAIEQLHTDAQNGLSQAQVWQRQQEYRADRQVRSFFEYTSLRPSFLRLRVAAAVLAALVCVVLAVLEILNIRANRAYSFIPCLILLVALLLNAGGAMLLGRRLRRIGRKAVQDMRRKARVLRQGEQVVCFADEVVPGDILLLEAGDLVAADARLIEVQGLRCLQKAVTGQSEPADKDGAGVVENIAPLSARCNMVYAGTAVLTGSARAVVTEVGRQMQIASRPVGRSAYTEERKKWCAVMCLLIPFCAVGATVLLLIGRLCGGEWLPALLFSAVFAAGCAAVDWEMLYHAVYLNAAAYLDGSGMTVRHEAVLDRAADISVLMSEKTGALTGEKMALTSFVVGDRRFDFGDAEPQSVQFLLQLATLCCVGSVDFSDGVRAVSADPTEAAILLAAVRRKMYPDVLQAEFPRLQCLPFTAQRQRMSSLHIIEGRYVLVVKGTPEAVFAACDSGVDASTAEKEGQLREEGLRVVAVAYRFLDQLPAQLSEQHEQGLTLLGLLGLRDIPQEKVMDTLEQCIGAGITPVIFTGDHPQTAYQMARRLGLVQRQEQLVSGENMPLQADDVRVCARLDWQQKQQLLRTLQQGGKAVAIGGSTMQDVALTEGADIVFAARLAQQPMCDAADVLLEHQDLSCLARLVRAGRGAYRRLWQSSLFALISLLSVWLLSLIGLIFKGEWLLNMWQWACAVGVQLPLCALLLACRGGYGWQPKSRDWRSVLFTAGIPFAATLIAAFFAWQPACYVAFSVGLLVQAVLLSKQR